MLAETIMFSSSV